MNSSTLRSISRPSSRSQSTGKRSEMQDTVNSLTELMERRQTAPALAAKRRRLLALIAKDS